MIEQAIIRSSEQRFLLTNAVLVITNRVVCNKTRNLGNEASGCFPVHRLTRMLWVALG